MRLIQHSAIGIQHFPTGQLQVEEGLYSYGSRFYDNALGRFISADTLIPQPGSPLAWDRYAYANGNPIRYNDPSGHMADQGGGFGEMSYAFWQAHYATQRLTNIEHNQLDPLDFAPSTHKSPLVYSPYLGGIFGDITDQKRVHYLGDYLAKEYLTDIAILWGYSGSTSGLSAYWVGGQEEIIILKKMTRATYHYGGTGSANGAGASGTAYFGLASNVNSPEDYRGISASMGFTVSIWDVGITGAYFWNGDYAPLTPGVVQGFQLGYAPGAQMSLWWSNVMYTLDWTNK